jgi:hypothetical protein
MIAFYEIKVRKIFPKLPSVFRIAFELYQRGLLTMGTVTWLISSLPQGMIGGLAAAGGLAMHGTSAIASGAAAAGSALVGGAASVAGTAANTVTQGINLINPSAAATDIAQVVAGGHRAAEQVTSVATAGVNGATMLAGGATKAVADSISLLGKGQTVVASNVTQPVSRQQDNITNGLPVPGVAKDAIQAAVGSTNAIAGAAIQSVTNPAAAIEATQAAVAKNVTKLANVLEGVNPLQLKISSNGSQDSQVGIPRLRAL